MILSLKCMNKKVFMFIKLLGMTEMNITENFTVLFSELRWTHIQQVKYRISDDNICS